MSESSPHPSRAFQFCPRCGAVRTNAEPPCPFRCDACGFLLYFNPAVASAAILLRADGQALFIRRAHEPSKGMLGMVGGFIDIGETAEEGLRREIREEVGLEVGALEFLCSQPNSYVFRGVTYPVLDLFFVARATAPESASALDGVESLCWMDPMRMNPAEMAFPSMVAAMQRFQQRIRDGSGD